MTNKTSHSLGFGELIAHHLTDSRRGKNTRLPLADLLRQSVHSRIAGYEDVNDAERLSQDLTFRLIDSEKIWERGATLEERGVKYAVRIPSNESPERDIVELLTRPVGWPSHKPVVWYKSFLYQAASWRTARRVVTKVEFRSRWPRGPREEQDDPLGTAGQAFNRER